ncbi:hypothetical protein [Nitrosomonas sp. Nm33]|uniref:hypothetical protein n=1 Tax=Nitrosomonas sp. Nm33 TaxID=133724 RepID=UPI00089ABA1B|nr:hypothetical protein [Nitrosomonas sp. Nm33]SDY64879.1 hypothetical protein SAMN05421755_103610 [Nitrosomonas sp. Nm33]
MDWNRGWWIKSGERQMAQRAEQWALHGTGIGGSGVTGSARQAWVTAQGYRTRTRQSVSHITENLGPSPIPTQISGII